MDSLPNLMPGLFRFLLPLNDQGRPSYPKEAPLFFGYFSPWLNLRCASLTPSFAGKDAVAAWNDSSYIHRKLDILGELNSRTPHADVHRGETLFSVVSDPQLVG